MHTVLILSIIWCCSFQSTGTPGVLILGQKYVEDKNIKSKKISNGKILVEIILLIIAIWVILLVVALISFHPSDSSWLQITWNEPIKNLAGGIGAWSADILFSVFGILAYAIPLIMLLGCWNIYKNIDNQNCPDFFVLSLRLIGGLALMIASCALASLNINDLPNFSSGGIIGNVFSNAILPWFNVLGTTLVLLCIWVVSFTLFTGWSWLMIAEKIGELVSTTISLIINHTRRNNEHQTTEAYISANQDKLYNSTNVDYIDSADIFFSASPFSQLAKEESSNDKNHELHSEKALTLIPDETKISFDIQSAILDKYDEDIFNKP